MIICKSCYFEHKYYTEVFVGSPTVEVIFDSVFLKQKSCLPMKNVCTPVKYFTLTIGEFYVYHQFLWLCWFSSCWTTAHVSLYRHLTCTHHPTPPTNPLFDFAVIFIRFGFLIFFLFFFTELKKKKKKKSPVLSNIVIIIDVYYYYLYYCHSHQHVKLHLYFWIILLELILASVWALWWS